MKGLKGKNAIVTGGGAGIGRAISKRLAEEGCKLAILDLNLAGAEETAASIRATGGHAHAFELDISDYQAALDVTAKVEDQHGTTDILINNAGWDRVGNFLETDIELWHQVVSVNLWGPIHMHAAIARGMSERGGGRIVNISSDAARVGSSGEAVYSACKGGMISFSKSLARELARQGVCINVVCPGPAETALLDSFLGEGDMGQKIYDGLKRAIPFKRLAQPEDICGMVVFLVSDEASYITGQVISVSGGLTMAG